MSRDDVLMAALIAALLAAAAIAALAWLDHAYPVADDATVYCQNVWQGVWPDYDRAWKHCIAEGRVPPDAIMAPYRGN